MGRKGHWLSAVRRVFISDTKQNQNHQQHRHKNSKRGWGFSACTNPSYEDSPPETRPASPPAAVVQAVPSPSPSPPPSSPKVVKKTVRVRLVEEEERRVDVKLVGVEEEERRVDVKLVGVEEEERRVDVKLVDVEEEERRVDVELKHAQSVAAATAEAAVVPAQAAAEVVRLTAPRRFKGRLTAQGAAIVIQAALRGYMARKALRALRGLVRLKSLVHGNAVKRQTATTLHCMQTLARVQSQIRSRRIRMTEENQALQRQLLLKRERALERLRIGEEWDDSLQSKEQIEASFLNKQEAAIKRERALAYAFSHQWKSSSRSVNPMFMDPSNPQWGWSWLERWMSARPWENRSTTDNDHASIRSASHSNGGEAAKYFTRRASHSDRTSTYKSSRPPSRQSPVTPTSKATRTKVPSPRAVLGDDSRSTGSLKMHRSRRHSMGGWSTMDDESLACNSSNARYMTPTRSLKVKSRYQTPNTDNSEASGSVKKRLSFPMPEDHNVPTPIRVRRHSVPPKVDIASLKEVSV